MNISDLFGNLAPVKSGYPQSDDLDYDTHQRRLQEERDTDEHRSWTARFHARSQNFTGPYCFRCHAKIDWRKTGDVMAPYAVYDRGTNARHYIRCYQPKRKR